MTTAGQSVTVVEPDQVEDRSVPVDTAGDPSFYGYISSNETSDESDGSICPPHEAYEELEEWCRNNDDQNSVAALIGNLYKKEMHVSSKEFKELKVQAFFELKKLQADKRQLQAAKDRLLIEQAAHLQNFDLLSMLPCCNFTAPGQYGEATKGNGADQEDPSRGRCLCNPWNHAVACFLGLKLSPPTLPPLEKMGQSTEKLKWFFNKCIRLSRPPILEPTVEQPDLAFRKGIHLRLPEKVVRSISCVYKVCEDLIPLGQLTKLDSSSSFLQDLNGGSYCVRLNSGHIFREVLAWYVGNETGVKTYCNNRSATKTPFQIEMVMYNSQDDFDLSCESSMRLYRKYLSAHFIKRAMIKGGYNVTSKFIPLASEGSASTSNQKNTITLREKNKTEFDKLLPEVKPMAFSVGNAVLFDAAGANVHAYSLIGREAKPEFKQVPGAKSARCSLLSPHHIIHLSLNYDILTSPLESNIELQLEHYTPKPQSKEPRSLISSYIRLSSILDTFNEGVKNGKYEPLPDMTTSWSLTRPLLPLEEDLLQLLLEWPGVMASTGSTGEIVLPSNNICNTMQFMAVLNYKFEQFYSTNQVLVADASKPRHETMYEQMYLVIAVLRVYEDFMDLLLTNPYNFFSPATKTANEAPS